ncbi:hypothetical protein KC727_00095 [Candidatus Kaiserbacteria bacterium]|nr:hypothetical protein [Candidatus Kaiserbacteria bacterium]
MYTFEERMERYLQLDPAFQHLYSSVESAAFNARLIEMYDIQDFGPFIDAIGDVILGFYRKSELSKLLTQTVGLSEEVVARMLPEIDTFLRPIPGTLSKMEVLQQERGSESVVRQPLEGIATPAYTPQAVEVSPIPPTPPPATAPHTPTPAAKEVVVPRQPAAAPKERLAFWPDGTPKQPPRTVPPPQSPNTDTARPLTRNELMASLSPRRTMAEDVARAQHTTQQDS